MKYYLRGCFVPVVLPTEFFIRHLSMASISMPVPVMDLLVLISRLSLVVNY